MKAKADKFFSVLFLVVGAATVCEFLFVRGLFTSFIAMAAVALAGLVNIALALLAKCVRTALLYALCTVALCMGYIALL